jgi:rhamnulokinase
VAWSIPRHPALHPSSANTIVTRSSYIAVDLGASSGRVMRGTLTEAAVQLEEIRRFPTRSLQLADGLHWDIGYLHSEIMAGTAAAIEGGPARGIGFSSWGVDYALLADDGTPLGAPFHHRDGRTAGLAARLDAEFLYAETGIQTLEINTLVQLLAEKPEGAIASARSLLFMPDLFGYVFTGRQVAERTIASTSQLLAWDGRPSAAVRDYAGLPDLVPPVAVAGSLLGAPLPRVRERTGFTGLVLSVAGHDTASAVAAIPAEPGEDIAFISCGTWGLVGFERQRPELGAASLAAGFTNEHGIDGTYRYLRNVSGLWLLTESLRFWNEPADVGTTAALVVAASSCPRFRSIIDPLHPGFIAPGDMPGRIAVFCASTGQPVPETRAQFARCIIDSLALSFADAVRTGAALTGSRSAAIHLIGGGSQIRDLCATLADVAGLPVIAGPVEATSLGNVLVQARALGQLDSLEAIRSRVAASVDLTRYEPGASPAATAAVTRFEGIARSAFGMLGLSKTMDSA